MRAMSEPSVLANTAMRRRPFSRWIWLGPSVSITSAMVPSGMRPAGLSISISPSARVAAVGIAQAHDDIEALRLVDDLRDDLAVRQRLERFGDLARVEAVERRLGVVDANLQLRDAHLLFGLQVDDAGDRP